MFVTWNAIPKYWQRSGSAGTCMPMIIAIITSALCGA